MSASALAAYIQGTPALCQSPLLLAEFERMKKVAFFGQQDVEYLHLSLQVLEDQFEQVLDEWYGLMDAHPQLVASFKPRARSVHGEECLRRLRERFHRWLLDTASAWYDQAWLDCQRELSLRMRCASTSGAQGDDSSELLGLRELFPLLMLIPTTLQPFLRRKGHPAEQVRKMHAAWVRSCLLQVMLWSHPYMSPADF